MSSRRTRLKKLLDLRQQQLEDCARELSRSRDRELRARERVDDETRELNTSLDRRASLAVEAANNDRWSSENDWLELRALHHQAATAALGKAELSRQRAHAEVLHARTQLKKLEVLQDRLRREELRDEERRDRRLHDEVAQKSASRGQR